MAASADTGDVAGPGFVAVSVAGIVFVAPGDIGLAGLSFGMITRDQSPINTKQTTTTMTDVRSMSISAASLRACFVIDVASQAGRAWSQRAASDPHSAWGALRGYAIEA